MSKIFVGKFETRGNLYIIDPLGKEKRTDIFKLTVKPGTYNAYVIRKVVPSLQKIASNDDFASRNYELIIEHTKNGEEIKYRKLRKQLTVNSGLGSILNKESYYKHHFSQVPLIGSAYGIIKEEIGLLLPRLESLKLSLATNSKADLGDFANGLKIHINKDEATLKRYYEQLESRNFDEIIKSCDYEEIIESLASGEFQAEAMNPYGVISRTGLGDGLYNIYVGKNSTKQIIACKIVFIPEK